MDFTRAHQLQLEVVDARISGRLDRDLVIVVEHPPVFTIGRRGNRNHLKVSSDFLETSGIEILHIERGGDITYHGPGQIVLYPICHLSESGLGVVEFVEKLEEVMLRTADDMGVSARRDSRNHGVWAEDRKLGFIGIAVRRSVSFHGISLNVNLPLEPFTWINPCGLENIVVTNLDIESGQPVTFKNARESLLWNFEHVFSVSLQQIDTQNIKDSIQSKRE
jgi:lipoate-protein ligase B